MTAQTSVATTTRGLRPLPRKELSGLLRLLGRAWSWALFPNNGDLGFHARAIHKYLSAVTG